MIYLTTICENEEIMKPTIGVLFGGKSVEHEVSIISAIQTISAIDQTKYDVIPVYIAKSGCWYTSDLLANIDNFKNIDSLLEKCIKCAVLQDGVQAVLHRIPSSRFKNNILGKIDVAFPVMHGTCGEDGTLQGYLEMSGLPYVGCNVLSSSVGMDKVVTKTILKSENLPVLDHIWFYSVNVQTQIDKTITAIENKFKYPLIVKPANLGSSVGISTASNKFELEEALDLASTFSRKILIEPKVENLQEINCSVLGDYEHCEASICEEPVRTDEILSFKDKYLAGNKSKGMSNLKRKIPADISQEMSKDIQHLAKQAFQALDCSGVSRIDFLIDKSEGAIYINEINTIPGSLSFYLWEPTGIGFTELTTKLIDLAFKRSRENIKLTFSFDTNLLSMRGKSGSKL